MRLWCHPVPSREADAPESGSQAILACGSHAGLIPLERCVALLARIAEHHLIPRGSFFQRDFIRKQRAAGLPLHLIAHEDVIIFQRAQTPARSAPVPAAALGRDGPPLREKWAA
jgi:hypothetical protein